MSKHEVIPPNDGTPVMVLSSAHVRNNTNRHMNILRKDANHQDPPMLVDGVYDALLYSTRIHCFFREKSALIRPHKTPTNFGHLICLYNCIVTKRRENTPPSVVHSMEYCVYEGQTSEEKNFVFQAVCAYSEKPFSIYCIVFNMKNKWFHIVPTSRVRNVIQHMLLTKITVIYANIFRSERLLSRHGWLQK